MFGQFSRLANYLVYVTIHVLWLTDNGYVAQLVGYPDNFFYETYPSIILYMKYAYLLIASSLYLFFVPKTVCTSNNIKA